MLQLVSGPHFLNASSIALRQLIYSLHMSRKGDFVVLLFWCRIVDWFRTLGAVKLKMTGWHIKMTHFRFTGMGESCPFTFRTNLLNWIFCWQFSFLVTLLEFLFMKWLGLAWNKILIKNKHSKPHRKPNKPQSNSNFCVEAQLSVVQWYWLTVLATSSYLYISSTCLK